MCGYPGISFLLLLKAFFNVLEFVSMLTNLQFISNFAGFFFHSKELCINTLAVIESQVFYATLALL